MDMKLLRFQSDQIAPDGADVHVLLSGVNGSLAHFSLAPGTVSLARQHKSVEELWYFVGGRGEMCIGDDVTVVCPGVAVRIPTATRFQFRSEGPGPLEAVAVTMPPWPTETEEAVPANDYWPR
jgi:mannose-6-phosphate isomerase-like protein (cupin superfamily)